MNDGDDDDDWRHLVTAMQGPLTLTLMYIKFLVSMTVTVVGLRYVEIFSAYNYVIKLTNIIIASEKRDVKVSNRRS